MSLGCTQLISFLLHSKKISVEQPKCCQAPCWVLGHPWCFEQTCSYVLAALELPVRWIHGQDQNKTGELKDTSLPTRHCLETTISKEKDEHDSRLSTEVHGSGFFPWLQPLGSQVADRQGRDSPAPQAGLTSDLRAGRTQSTQNQLWPSSCGPAPLKGTN